MKINKQKLLVSFCLVILLLNMLPFGAAYADLTESLFSKFMSNSLRALEIQMNALGLGIADGARDVNDFLARPFKVVANDFVYVPYTTSINTIDDYFNRSKLTIRPNAILIDDVPYSNIWLSKDAAEQFRINSFDIITAWNIASESNGTFVSGIGHVCKLPIYEFSNNSTQSQYYSMSNSLPPESGELYKVGNVNINKYWQTSTRPVFSAYFPAGTSDSRNFVADAVFRARATILNHRNPSIATANFYVSSNGNVITKTFPKNSPYFDLDPFEFDWVAEEIPIDAELPDNYGLNVQVPTSYITNWLVDYGDTYTNQELNFYTTNTDLMVAIDSLLEIINNYTYTTDTNIYYDFSTDIEPVPPTPTPTPTPTPPPEPTPPMPSPTPSTSTDLIANTPWEWLENWLQSIRDLLRAIYEYVKQIVEYYLENIHADLYNIEQKLDLIIEKLEDLGDEIVNKLSLIYVDIGSILDDLIIDIEQAPIKLADKTLDILKLVFLPILTRLRNALGIWHYVIEWLSSISAPFAYFINILSSAYPIAMTPIYACVAGTLCILVYKRFGR